MKILACQIAAHGIIDRKSRDNHIKRMVTYLREQCKESRPDLVVLPELSSIEYSTEVFKNLSSLSEELYGSTYLQFSDLAKELGIFISFGFPLHEAEKFYITQMVIGPDGELVTLYNKMHIAQFGASEEKPYFERGDSLSVFEVCGIKTGTIICYDIRFPEYIRHLVREHQLDLILHPSAFTRDRSFYSWHHFVITRALENQIYFLSLNRAGKGWGNSIFCPPWVDDSAEPVKFNESEECRRFEINKKSIQESRETFPFNEDSREQY
ncbi:MAG: carbon-nitrogen hydrolase family protein, partial [Proteobacteria bacterium]|nr:carbon-nitrogen hydrolase family protein [Pseudomonadota bacterium]